ncbi:MAG: hypothetical protein ABIR47_16415 [Candidatus Kapaibacterium sp.]
MSTTLSMDAASSEARQASAASAHVVNNASAVSPQIINNANNVAVLDMFRATPHYSKYLPIPTGVAGTYNRPAGTIIICILLCVASILFPAISPQPTPFSTNGSGSFSTISSSSENRTSTLTQPVSYTGNGTGPLVGNASWSFDLTRTVQNSSIIANTLTSDFPATGDLFVNIQGTLGVTPGVTYRSRQPVHLSTTHLNTYDPQVNEVWTLAGQTAFEDTRNPGVTVFTLQSANATFN